jgi:hypothetical protein
MVHVDGLVGYFYDTIVEEEVGNDDSGWPNRRKESSNGFSMISFLCSKLSIARPSLDASLSLSSRILVFHSSVSKFIIN